MNLPPLPELPRPRATALLAESEWSCARDVPVFTADQLRAYAMAYGRAVQDACRGVVLGVGLDASAAAAKPDVAMFHTDSYINGYSDACVDCDEAIRNGVIREGEGE